MGESKNTCAKRGRRLLPMPSRSVSKRLDVVSFCVAEVSPTVYREECVGHGRILGKVVENGRPRQALPR